MKTRFIVAGLVIIGAIVYLIVTATSANSQYFLTVQELQQRKTELAGQDVRVSGVILGDTIQYDAKNLKLEFTVANVPGEQKEIDAEGGLANALHLAATDTSRPRLKVVYVGVKPDLLRNEAQAIMTGKLGPDGSFAANELLLKCPTRYQDSVPNQVK
jgi:cytochrome c-type biogenesis protein CcmE